LSVQLVSKISNLCGPDSPTSQTDGRTDGRHAIAIAARQWHCHYRNLHKRRNGENTAIVYCN